MNGAELKTDCNRFLLRTSYITGSRLLMHLASKLVRVDRADRKRNNSRAGMSLAYLYTSFRTRYAREMDTKLKYAAG